MGQAKRHATKIRPKPSKAAFSVVLSNFDKCRREVADDAISDAASAYVGQDVRVTFSDSGLNNGRIIWLFGRPDQFHSLLCCI